ncbi:hypothetical protein K493DRAFT_411669 [Basidiobolus meristosporus CBS 931.73]|uniref:Uncharacterized protein n=1 Tax=Basidiobolus meristosporus CBS 931.73 TaxID=1314790 RepID=A0A1Y1XCF1_9FUNG|nr:hypothetical protein K493DRAFT_411669 [Basidiobolus meristosporus CBS 931.73]|eukprot:ORX83461.1 hypothetical protein K493DRAFT_411669 [Basidiobolus meristosporus CBS 931.73]
MATLSTTTTSKHEVVALSPIDSIAPVISFHFHFQFVYKNQKNVANLVNSEAMRTSLAEFKNAGAPFVVTHSDLTLDDSNLGDFDQYPKGLHTQWTNPSDPIDYTEFLAKRTHAGDFGFNWHNSPGFFTDIQSIYTSFESPEGADDGVYNFITSVWNNGEKSPRVELGLPGGLVQQCENAENCYEGAVAHDLVFGKTWLPGVRYDFLVHCERDGENEIFSSYVLKDDHWMLITRFIGPGYRHYLGNFMYQFLENPDWIRGAPTPQRRGLYYNQHIKYVGSEEWHPAEVIFPDGGFNPNGEFWEFIPMPLDNGVLVVVDGGNSSTLTAQSRQSMRVNLTNVEPPVNVPTSVKGKHTATEVLTYMSYGAITERATTTTTTQQHWVTDLALTTTLVSTTKQKVTSRGTKTRMHTVTMPTHNVTETEVRVQTTTVTPGTSFSTVDATTVEDSTLTLYETDQLTLTGPAVTVYVTSMLK